MTNSSSSISITSTIHFKLFILIWLTLQSTVHTLIIKYSRNRGTYEGLYYPTVAVFFMEILKCLFSLLVTYIQSMGFHDFLSKLHVNIWINWREAMCIFVPTMLYTLQNNLVYISLHHLNAASFVIIYQLKILFAALFSILLLGRKISLTQWLSIFVLFVGVIIITWTQNSAKINVAEHRAPIIGILAVLFASTISGLAGVMVEKVLKDASKISLWLRNIQMSIISIPSSFVTIFIINKNEIIKNGMLHGFDSIVWLTVIWYSIGGISVAICLKYADNIAKDFAIAISIIFTAIGSIFIFNFQPDILFFVGLILVIGSTFFYSKSHKIIADFVKKQCNNYSSSNYQQIEEQ